MVFDWLQLTAIATTPTPIISPWSITGSWITFAITVAGLMYLYVRNDGSKGKHFLYCYFPLSVTVGWKFVVAMFAVMWLLEAALVRSSPEFRGWSSTVALAALNLAMFWRIGEHLAGLARERAAQPHAPADALRPTRTAECYEAIGGLRCWYV